MGTPQRRTERCDRTATATVARALAAWVVLLGIASLPNPVRASDSSEPDWIPSLALGFEGGRFESDTRYTHSLGSDAPEVPTPGNDNGRFNSSILGLEAELLGPVLGDWIGEPRVFVRGALRFVPSGDDKERLLEVGSVGPLIGNQPRGTNAPPIEISDIQGQGILTEANIDLPMWAASLGIAFATPIPWTEAARLRIRTSLEYDYQALEIDQRFAAATDLGLGPPAPQCLNDLRPPELIPFSCHTASGASRQTEHRLGPGLELEFIFTESHPIQFSAFVGAKFLFLLSDEGIVVTDELATSSIEREEFGIRGRGGFRVSWIGWAR